MSMSIKIRRSKAEAVIRNWDLDEEMQQALGLAPYWGIDRPHSGNGGRSGKPRPCLREPEFVDDGESEDWADSNLNTGRFADVS